MNAVYISCAKCGYRFPDGNFSIACPDCAMASAYKTERFLGETWPEFKHRMAGGLTYTSLEPGYGIPAPKPIMPFTKGWQVLSGEELLASVDNYKELAASAKKYDKRYNKPECDCYDRACHDGHAPWCSTRGK